MSERKVWCEKLQQELPGLETPPYPGDLGEKIFNHISQQAWDMWLGQQTMLINEHRLSLIEPEARKFLTQQMQGYLFEGMDTTPQGFTQEQQKDETDE